MQMTFIARNLTQQTLDDVAALDARAAYAKLQRWAFGDLKHCVSAKFGNTDAFRDRVEWNSAFKSNREITFRVEPRKGYRLITFTAA